MFTTIAWSASVDQVALAAIAAVPDPHVRVNINDIIVPTALANLVGSAGIGINLTRVQLVSPSLRRLLNLEVAPFDRTALPAVPFKLHDLRDNPIKLDGEEALNAFTAEDGAGATRMNALAWIADGPIVPIKGDIRTVRVTAATTLVAFQWTNAALTFDQSLPAGRYQLVGARFASAGLLCARAVFPGNPWRPGVIGIVADSGPEGEIFRRGNWGVWGEFTHNTPPTIDFLSATADAAETGELDLIKVG
jgi:hypothetical protein